MKKIGNKNKSESTRIIVNKSGHAAYERKMDIEYLALYYRYKQNI